MTLCTRDNHSASIDGIGFNVRKRVVGSKLFSASGQSLVIFLAVTGPDLFDQEAATKFSVALNQPSRAAASVIDRP